MPNACWQSGFTHYPLAYGTNTGILTWLDDHSRCVLSLTGRQRVTGPSSTIAAMSAVSRRWPGWSGRPPTAA